MIPPLALAYVAATISGAVCMAWGIRDDRPVFVIAGSFVAGVSLVLLASAIGFIR